MSGKLTKLTFERIRLQNNIEVIGSKLIQKQFKYLRVIHLFKIVGFQYFCVRVYK